MPIRGVVLLSEPKSLTLSEAVAQWVDPSLRRAREDAYAAINQFLSDLQIDLTIPTEQQLKHFDAFKKNAEMCEDVLQRRCRRVDMLVINDLRRRVQAGLLFLEGVPDDNTSGTARHALPRHRASEYEFDPTLGVVRDGAVKFLAVTVSQIAPPPTQVYAARTSSLPPGLAEKPIQKLTDDEVMHLLEEHARRVVEHDALMIAPGKISLMPIIRRKLEHRASQGQLEPRVSAEAAVLEHWIAERLPSHQTPTAATIENSLRKNYAALKARSNGMKA